MNEYEKLDALYQRDQGIGVPYPETDTNVGYKMNNSTIQPLTKKQLIERLEDYLDDDAVNVRKADKA